MKEWKRIFKRTRVVVFLIFSAMYFLFFIVLRFGPLEGDHTLKSAIEYPAYRYVLTTAGRTVDEEDYEKIKEESEKSRTPEFDQWVERQELLREYGIDNYEEFNVFIPDFSLEHPEVAGPLMEDFYNTFSDEEVERSMEDVNYSYMLQDIVKRYEAYEKSRGTDFMPEKLVDDTREIFRALSIWMALGTLIFALPYLVEDNQANIAVLQYTIHSEKKVRKSKLKAVLGTSLILSMVESLCVLAYMLFAGYFMFAGSRMNSFASDIVFLDDLGYMQYIFLSLLMGTGMALACAAGIVLFTGNTKLYANAVLNNIPLLAAVIGYIIFCFPVLGKTVKSTAAVLSLPLLALALLAFLTVRRKAAER